MANNVIQVEGVSKQYRLGTVGTGTFSHDLNRWWHTIRGKEDPYLKIGEENDRSLKGTSDYVWALRDINFNVKEGEVIGIIGKNGAGKSTLLKLLSRTTAPTTGSIKMKGRIASLLEVGTGFHPELSGRDNIYLNGAILGMTRQEVSEKFDEIVKFSGIERYVDTPVKRYSSGMYVRLAFAVAAHLEPDILIVDEVLAVGDAEFQKKAIGKMQDVAKGGHRTVLFVSHNMNAVKDLCERGVLLENGKVSYVGEISEVINRYLNTSSGNTNNPIFFNQQESKAFQLISASLFNEKGILSQDFEADSNIILELQCVVRDKIAGLYGYLTVMKNDGTLMIENDTFDVLPNILDSLPVGEHTFRLVIPRRTLAIGEYNIYMNFTSPLQIKGFNVDAPGEIIKFSVDDTSTKRGRGRKSQLGTIIKWEHINKIT
ncbi:polysaccharide ABC transporter ATP-binding protein [Pontibacter toksunensis]|uniref:Polysaccharide ABC transporter ATP-binding protein n=1 Tax=Pontibacter toksunensis TaxID=1332631 RepID=A0ABW6BNJ7_9BACT